MNPITIDELHDVIDRLAGRKIAVLGDYMLDRYIWGTVSRISPEAPVPVVEVREENTVPGGAGNVVRNLADLGLAPLVCGIIGEDDNGRALASHLEEMGADLMPLVQTDTRRTTTKIRVIANRQQVVRVDYDHAVGPTGELYDELISRGAEALKQADAMIFSDYAKGALTEQVSREMLARAREMELTVCVDPKPDHIPRYTGATLVSPNEAEAASATGIKITDDRSVIAAARKLQETTELSAAVITRGGKGICLYEGRGVAHLIPAVPTEVFDVTGAGDTAISALCACLSCGASLLQAGIIANAAGGEVVRHIGCATVTPQQLHEAIDEKAEVLEEIQTIELAQA